MTQPSDRRLDPKRELSRRKLLKVLALAPSAAVLPQWALAQSAAAGLITPEVCLVQPELTEGPFYVDPGLIRRDITEGRLGQPLRMRLQVVTAACAPVADARVDVWHCDAEGVYSGVEGDQGTFLRGTQRTGADGVAEFDSIFPGWYPGRVTHVHYKVFLTDRVVLTGQMFFADATVEAVHRGHAAYAAKGAQGTSLARDRIALSAGERAVAVVAPGAGEGPLVASLVVGIDPAAETGSGMMGWLFGRG